MSKFDEQLSRMKALCTYGTVNEDKKQSNYTLEYHATAADGKEYGIVKECSRFYIKSTTPDKKNLAESYQYIGGWANKKNYEYDSYNNALKNFELKMESINEAHDSKVNVETLDPFKKEDLVIEGTEAMRNEIARQRQIMYNTAMLMNESTEYAVKGGSACSTSQPEAPKGAKGDKAEGSKDAKADPDYKGSKTGLIKKASPFKEDPKGINESCCDTDLDAGLKRFASTENGEADTEHNNDPFTENVNEETNDWASEGLPSSAGVGEADTDHNNDPFNKSVNEAEDDGTEDVETEDALEDDDIDLDDESEDAETEDVETEDALEDDDINLDDESEDDDMDLDDESEGDDFELDYEEDDAPNDVDFPSVGDGDELAGETSDIEAKIADLESQLEALKAQLNDKGYSEEDDYDYSEGFGAEGVDDDDFDSEEDSFDTDEIEDDEEMEDEDDFDDMQESKKHIMGRIVESVVRKMLNEDELHVFGKHPGYRKKPMDLPPTGQDKNEHGEDINDDSVHNEEPFGQQIGDGDPFNQMVDAVTKDVMYQLKKGVPIEGEGKKKE